jgi:hypothetical protein
MVRRGDVRIGTRTGYTRLVLSAEALKELLRTIPPDKEV